jgi:hypothetical protein
MMVGMMLRATKHQGYGVKEWKSEENYGTEDDTDDVWDVDK